MTESKEIIILSIGPVQSYISTARRTQDLRTASQILSRLSFNACKKASELECEIVYPQVKSPDDGAPNRMVLIAPYGKGGDIAKSIVEKIEELREKISKDVRSYLDGKISNSSYEKELWDSQVKNWLEIYWVCVPWDGTEANYPAQFQKASLGLDGRKGLRHFPHVEESNIICTLCGTRSALGGKEFWDNCKLPNRLIRSQEKLCAVCTIKRLLPIIPESPISKIAFPSTASIASASYQNSIMEHWDKVEYLITPLVEKMKNLGLDVPDSPINKEKFGRIEGAYLYKDSYQKETIRKETGNEPDSKDLKEIKELLQRINMELISIKATCTFANPYYAVLHIDGDHMGKLLDSVKKKEDHKAISQKLSILAQKMQDIVKKNLGQVVYSGGDDLLALLPVDTALHTADAVQKEFCQTLSDAGFKGNHMSGGLAITHHNTPLQSAIESAREAEKQAKNECDRNSIVLHLAKRSGEIRQVALKWNSPGGFPVPINDIQMLIQAISNNDLSGKLAYELWDESHALADAPDNPSVSWFKLELYRLMKRHSAKDWKTEAELRDMVQQICNLWDFIPDTGLSKVDQIVSWLLVARFLAQGE